MIGAYYAKVVIVFIFFAFMFLLQLFSSYCFSWTLAFAIQSL